MPAAGATIPRKNENTDATSTVRIELPNNVVVTGPSMALIEQTCAEEWRHFGQQAQQTGNGENPPGDNPSEGADANATAKGKRKPMSVEHRRKIAMAQKRRQMELKKKSAKKTAAAGGGA
jgi:hypothetical protein